MKSTGHYAKVAGAAVAAWFALSVTTGALGVFHLGSKYAINSPLPLGLAVALPILLFIAWYAFSPRFRQFALSLDARILTIVQSWRLGGFVFLILYSYGILPGVFALPAGWGDISIGATAWLAATYLTRENGRKRLYIAWQLLGVADLMTAVSLGVTSSTGPLRLFEGPVSADAMTRLPLSLIPTFAVPLLLIFHFISIAQARRWPAPAGSVPLSNGYPATAPSR